MNHAQKIAVIGATGQDGYPANSTRTARPIFCISCAIMFNSKWATLSFLLPIFEFAKAMSITRKRIAITGAEGVVGTVLRRGFPSRYEVVPITRSVQPFHSLVADVTDLGALIHGFTEVHAVIHLAAAARLNAEWNAILSGNIVGTRNVFEAARLAGVRAVVFASSGHVLVGRGESWGGVVLAPGRPCV
jgi:hypothetical protein